MSHTAQVTEIVVYLSTTENLELFEDDLQGHQNLPLKKNMLKGVIIVDIEMIAAKSYKSPDYSRWNGWQSIVIEFKYGDDWMDKADGNSQCLETYDTMRKTTESERKAKDQITEQANNSGRNGGRRYREPSESLSKTDSVESKVENEMLSVKMRLAKKKKRSDGIKLSLELTLRSKSAMMPRKQLPKPHNCSRTW